MAQNIPAALRDTILIIELAEKLYNKDFRGLLNLGSLKAIRVQHEHLCHCRSIVSRGNAGMVYMVHAP